MEVKRPRRGVRTSNPGGTARRPQVGSPSGQSTCIRRQPSTCIQVAIPSGEVLSIRDLSEDTPAPPGSTSASRQGAGAHMCERERHGAGQSRGQEQKASTDTTTMGPRDAMTASVNYIDCDGLSWLAAPVIFDRWSSSASLIHYCQLTLALRTATGACLGSMIETLPFDQHLAEGPARAAANVACPRCAP